MKDRDFRDYLQDILTSIKEIEEFTENLSFKTFSSDRKTINATLRSLEVLGEAAKKIPDPIRKDYPDIPWKKMAGTRDKLIHEYFGVDFEMIWKVAKEDLPKILPVLKTILGEM